jgi:adenylate kinase family enzyme
MVSAGKIIPAEMIVRMLRKIIYSGDGNTNYILSSFPDIIEQAKEFEKNCATINAIIYASSSEQPYVEIKNNNLTLFNIDALFQKEFRLQTITSTDDFAPIDSILAPTSTYMLVVGKSLSGKSTICNLISKIIPGIKYLDMNQVEAEIRKTMSTEEEPFEGEISRYDLYMNLLNRFTADAASGNPGRYIIEADTNMLVKMNDLFCATNGLRDP